MGRAVLLLVAGLLTAAPALADHVLHRPLDAEPETLDPAKSTGVPDTNVENDLFEGLVRLDPYDRPLPGVASSWERAADGVTYIFHLRPEARWSNGDPVTAQDFVYAWRRVVDPATAAADLGPLEYLVNARAINAGKVKDTAQLGVTAVDDHTLRAVTDGPAPLFLAECGYRFAFPVHRATIERWGRDWTKPEHIVADGPFVLKSWVPQGAIVVTRSPTYWDRTAIQLDEVDHVVTETDSTGLRAFQNGELDFFRVPTHELPKARKSMQDVLHTGPMNAFHYLFFNMKSGVFAQNKKLRQALALVTDVDAITHKIMPRGQEPAYGWVPPSVPGFVPVEADYAKLPMSERIAKARRLYAEAGYGADHPLHLIISYPTQEDNHTIIVAIAQMWRAALGVDAEPANEEFQVYLGRIARADYDAGWIGWNAGLHDPESFLEIFQSDKPRFNSAHYANPAVDTLLAQAGATLDPSVRSGLFTQAENILLDDMPAVPIQFDAVNFFVNPRLRGWVDSVAYPQSRWLSFAD